MFSCLNLVVEFSSRSFSVCSIQKPIGSHWFKKVLIELLSLSFFIKWWKSTQPFFFCVNKKYFCQSFFLTKVQHIQFFLIYWNVLLWIFSDCLAFGKNPTEFYIYLFFKKIIYTYIYIQFIIIVLLPTSHAAFWKNFTWCYY